MSAVANFVDRSGREVQAAQLTRETFAEIFEWSPGKQFFGPAPEGEPMPVTGYTVFTPHGRVKAEYGDWVVRFSSDDFRVCTDPEFAGIFQGGAE